LFGRGIKSWVWATFAKGTYGLFESMDRWVYDNTGLEYFDASRREATDMLYNLSVPFESQEVQDIMDIEAGDYAKAFNLWYITGVASESAPYMLATMAAGIATGGLAEGVLLGMGLSEGIGAAITLSRAGRVAQKTIAAISSGTSDAYLNMTANYNDLIKEGYSKERAKQIAFDAFKNELPVDILSGAVEMDGLFRATSKPTIKNIIKGGANKAGSILIEEPIQEVYQGYSLEEAKGTSKSLVDYAFFDKEGFNNLVGGFAGGLGTSAVTNAMGIAKNALSWNRLYNVSTADMQNAVRYAGVAQMVATPSEMQNSINLDLLKSAQSISQEEYQKIPNNERAQKEKAKNEYVNRTVAYVYGKSINNSVQNGLNIEDVHEHYKAHNEAISKAYSTLAELANETNKPMYKKQADYYASLAQKSEIGQQTPIYSLITPKGRVFISEQTAKTLGEGSIQQKNDSFAKAVRAGDIIGVQVVDDSQTAQSLIKKFDDAKLSQQLAVQQSQGGATEVGQPNQTNVQTPIEGTTEIPTTKGVIDNPNISPESTTSTAQEQVEVSGLGTETIGGEVAAQPEQQPISTTQSEIEKKTKEISDLEERLKEPFARPVIFEDDYSPSQLRDLKETWAKQDEEERIIIRKEIAQKQAELKALEQQPISTTQSGSNPALSKTEVLKKKIDESVEYKMEKFTRNNNADIKAILILQNDGVTHIDVDKKLNDSLIDKYKNLADKAHSEGNHDLGDAYQQAIAIIAEGAESTSIRFKKGTENEIDYELSKDSANKKLKRNEDAKAKMKADELESLLSKEQQPIEIDESTPFDLSIALQTKKEEQDAIQKQSTTEEVLLNERPEMGLQEVGEGNAQVEAVAEQGSQEEKIEVAPLSFTPKNFIEELIGVEGAVALSGINEQQRQELIKDRLRTTTLTPQKEKEREIVKLVKSHNGMRRNARERLDVRGRIMRLVNDYNKEYPNQKLTFKSWYGDVKVTRPSFDKKQKSTYQKDLTVANLDVSNASLDETEKTFSERSDEFQRKFIELMDLGVQFEFRDAGNKKFSQKMLDDAMNDLDNGIPSRRAAVILNTVEKAIEENVITVGGSLTEGFQYIPLNLAIEETKEMKYEDELRNLSNAEIVAIYENEILAQKELDNIIQQEYETEFESDPNDEFGNVRQLAPRKKRDIINPNQEGDNQGQTSEGTIEENQNVENETPKTTANREAGENLVGGNQADIPTNADGNGQREEEITENTPKQGEEGVGVVTGAPTPVISEMDMAVLDAMKPTFEIEFIPNAKFLNTSAPLENKSSQDAVKRRYQTIKKLLECL
jgi:hypothetical protein